jgi:hypothetical protein
MDCNRSKLEMRIWDIEPRKLCRNHLLGEHRELHARGYRHYSELNKRKATGAGKQLIFVTSRKKQIALLKQKNCACNI